MVSENKQVNIKTGANISMLLQSTVTIPQAFTELAKNSIQNSATEIHIELHKDHAIILDNGNGFNDSSDNELGMDDFDKYFVFGNSYVSDSSAVRLGHMGIGGKLANDKLSRFPDPHWTIETKNVNGRAYEMEYKPQGTEFLDDYNPLVKSLEKSTIPFKTGTKITIHELADVIKEDGWPEWGIKNELRTFFGVLKSTTDTNFKMSVNGDNLNFSYKLPGYNFEPYVYKFDYKDANGTKQQGIVEFNLSMVEDRKLIENHPVQDVSIASDVKICPLTLTNQQYLDTAVGILEKHDGEPFKNLDAILFKFNSLIGFVNCKELHTVLDGTGMPAKDLSHHALREDHPVTRPFYLTVYRVILDVIRKYLKLDIESRNDRLNGMSKAISELLAKDLPIPHELLQLGEEIEVDEQPGDDYVSRHIRKSLEQGERSQDSEMKPSTLGNMSRQNNGNKNVNWHEKKYKVNVPHIPHELLDFGPGSEKKISRINDMDTFKVEINTSNNKFKYVEEHDADGTRLTMFIAECMIKEITAYTNPVVTKDMLDEAISSVYEKHVANGLSNINID